MYFFFKDEVVQILSGLDDSLQLDPSKKWQQISSQVSKQTMKVIGKAMEGRFRYKDIELKWVLQQLHCHRRESWKVSVNPEKVKSEKKRKGTNSRRGDVSINILKCLLINLILSFIYYLIIEKGKTTKRPFLHV